ncbi:MAG: hypothetical protein ACE5ER_11505 [Nitrospinaceae bacterium]
MRIWVPLFLGLAFFLAGPVGDASEQRGELILIKGPLLEVDTFPPTPSCDSFFDVHRGNDRPNLFDYRHVHCQGRYTFTLRGRPGSTLTLFGKIDFGKERGFLIVRKRDDLLIWVDDLEGIPANHWVSREAKDGYGAYDAFYAQAPLFSQNIASVKWGQWWTGDPPGS